MSDRVQAAIYCRISLADEGDTTKTDDQARICSELAERLGWDVAEVYTDHSKSAWKHNRKRPAWDAMLAAIEAGKFTGIVVYHGDRLTRQPADLEKLIDLSRTRGIRLASPTGVKDLNNDDDQFVLGIEANVYRKESASSSRRKKAQFERMRRKGLTRPGGPAGRCFGFETDGVTHRTAEVAAVRRAAADILTGHSLGSVARALASEGVTTTSGQPMRLGALRRILSYPRMAGLMPDGVSPAAWEPVLERAEWEAVQAMLSLNGPNPRAGKGAQHLGSGIYRCGPCGFVLWAGGGTTGTAYVCRKCRAIRRSIPLLDAYVGRLVVGQLNHPGNPAPRLPETPGLAAEYATLTQQLAELDDVLRDPRRGSLPALLDRRDSLDRRLKELRSLAGDDGRSRIISAHRGMTWEQWLAEPLATRRSLVSALFTITVLPASRRGPGFNPDDVRFAVR